jgi:glycosyltransferase involved in cell wall biosynthesis
MKKLSCIVSCPISTYSGYGGRSRDFVKALIENYPEWDIKILSQRWGNTRMGYLEDFNDTLFTPLLISSVTYKPDVWIQITVPNEFQSIGKVNIGVTAGVETTICDPSWIEGCNRMDLTLVSSHHARNVFEGIEYSINNTKTNEVQGTLKLQKPVKVLFEGVDETVFKKLSKEESVFSILDSIDESFCFLTVGHWMQGNIGHDRKNIGYTIKSFLETFKNKDRQPALLLKVLQTTSSILDREQVLDKIDVIKRTVRGKLPNIYLLHGELSDEEMNNLYNHGKVKCLVSLTKGEGYGRPMAEFAMTGKPIIASDWSGHTDFLKGEFVSLIPGTLENVDESAAVKNILLKESHWFKPDDSKVADSFRSIFKEYNNFVSRSDLQRNFMVENFTYSKMREELAKILQDYINKIPTEIALQLPKLNLPKLEKL